MRFASIVADRTTRGGRGVDGSSMSTECGKRLDE